MQRRGPLSHCNRALAGATVSIVRDRRAPPAGGPMNTRMAAVALSTALAFGRPASAGVFTGATSIWANLPTNMYQEVQLSDDGRQIAFESDASNLAPGDRYGSLEIFVSLDVFIYDRLTGITIRPTTGAARGP